MSFLEDIDAHRRIIKLLVHSDSSSDIDLVQSALDACAGLSLENVSERSTTSSLPAAVERHYWLRKVIELTALAFQSPSNRPSFFRALHKVRVGMVQAMNFWIATKESYPHLRHQKGSERTDEGFSSFPPLLYEKKNMNLPVPKKVEQEEEGLDWLCQYVDSLEAIENMWYDVWDSTPSRSNASDKRMNDASKSSDGSSCSPYASILTLRWKRILTSERRAIMREIHIVAKEWMERLQSQTLASFSLGWYSLIVLYSYLSFCSHCLQLSAELWISSISDCSSSRTTPVGLPGIDIQYIGTRLCLGRRVMGQFERLQALWSRRMSSSRCGNVRLKNERSENDPVSGRSKALPLDRPYSECGNTAPEDLPSSRSFMPTSLAGATCDSSSRGSQKVQVYSNTAGTDAEYVTKASDDFSPEGPTLPVAPQCLRSTCPPLVSSPSTREIFTIRSNVVTVSSESSFSRTSEAREKENEKQTEMCRRFACLPLQMIQTYHRIQCRVALMCSTSLPLGKLVGLSQQFRKQMDSEMGISPENHREVLPRRQVLSLLHGDKGRSSSDSSDERGEGDETTKRQATKGHTRHEGRMNTTREGDDHEGCEGELHRQPPQQEGSDKTVTERGSKEKRRDRIRCGEEHLLRQNSAASSIPTNATRTTTAGDHKELSSTSHAASFPLLCGEDGIAWDRRETSVPITSKAMSILCCADRRVISPRCTVFSTTLQLPTNEGMPSLATPLASDPLWSASPSFLPSQPPWLTDVFPYILQEDPTLCVAWKDIMLNRGEDSGSGPSPTILIASWEGEKDPLHKMVVNAKNSKKEAFSSLSYSSRQSYICTDRDGCCTSVPEANVQESSTNSKVKAVPFAYPSISTSAIGEKEENSVEKEGNEVLKGYHPGHEKMTEVERERKAKDDAPLEECTIRMIWPLHSSFLSQEGKGQQQWQKNVNEYDEVRLWLSVVGHPIAALAKSDSRNNGEGASQTTFLNSTSAVDEEDTLCVLLSHSEECCVFFHFPSSTEVYVRRWGKEITGLSMLFFVVVFPSNYQSAKCEVLQMESILECSKENGCPFSESATQNGGLRRGVASSNCALHVTRETARRKERLEMLNRLYSAWIGESQR